MKRKVCVSASIAKSVVVNRQRTHSRRIGSKRASCQKLFPDKEAPDLQVTIEQVAASQTSPLFILRQAVLFLKTGF